MKLWYSPFNLTSNTTIKSHQNPKSRTNGHTHTQTKIKFEGLTTLDSGGINVNKTDKQKMKRTNKYYA